MEQAGIEPASHCIPMCNSYVYALAFKAIVLHCGALCNDSVPMPLPHGPYAARANAFCVFAFIIIW